MRYLGSAEFAKAVGVSPSTLFNWEKKGLFEPAYKTPTGRKMYSEEQLEKFYRGEYGGETGGSDNRKDVMSIQ